MPVVPEGPGSDGFGNYQTPSLVEPFDSIQRVRDSKPCSTGASWCLHSSSGAFHSMGQLAHRGLIQPPLLDPRLDAAPSMFDDSLHLGSSDRFQHAWVVQELN